MVPWGLCYFQTPKRQSGGSFVSIFLQLLLTEAPVNVGQCGWSNVGSCLQALGRNRETARIHNLSCVANFADTELWGRHSLLWKWSVFVHKQVVSLKCGSYIYRGPVLILPTKFYISKHHSHHFGLIFGLALKGKIWVQLGSLGSWHSPWKGPLKKKIPVEIVLLIKSGRIYRGVMIFLSVC